MRMILTIRVQDIYSCDSGNSVYPDLDDSYTNVSIGKNTLKGT